MQILVVDDLPANRKLLKVQLEGEGHRVFEAADGVEALELLQRETVDAIISDILMPRMDGYRLCYEIRRSERWKHLPFIICSSTYTSPADAKLAIEVGADRYLKKPASVAVLLEAVKEVICAGQVRTGRDMSLPEERQVMKQYSEALVRKLEEKNAELERAQAEMLRMNQALEDLVQERTVELREANAELDAFNRSVTHDLRSPLTEIFGYSELLQMNLAGPLDPKVREFVGKILAAGKRMESLIQELMRLSSVKQSDIKRETFRLNVAVEGIINRLKESSPERTVRTTIAPNMSVTADMPLLLIAMENLLHNAWKYSSKNPEAHIELGQLVQNGEAIYFVRDNGVGFDMKSAGRLFRPFERLHSRKEFPGTGIGLTLVQRIIARHGGRVWAESEPGKGATFYFTLGA